MMRPLRLAFIGLGTVGTAVLDLLAAQKDLLEKRSGCSFVPTALCARDRSKARGEHDLSTIPWFEDPVELSRDGDYDILCELIGGQHDPAYTAIKVALSRKKHVVTANKALLSVHGVELSSLAEENCCALHFEGAAGGGTPFVKFLRESMAGENIRRITGILNGTCNFILTQMTEKNWSFQEALAQAQSLGYAEQDPTFDVQGQDTAHKLSLLSALAFATTPTLLHCVIEGISDLSREDIELTTELGYVIKLLGYAEYENGRLHHAVAPYLVRRGTEMASVSDVHNGLLVEGEYGSSMMLMGPGAGGHATALAVISDLCDIARNSIFPPFGVKTSALTFPAFMDHPKHRSAYYLGLHVKHDSKVQAILEDIFQEEGLSIQESVQHLSGRNTRMRCGLLVPVTSPTAFENALEALEKSRYLLGAIRKIRVLMKG